MAGTLLIHSSTDLANGTVEASVDYVDTNLPNVYRVSRLVVNTLGASNRFEAFIWQADAGADPENPSPLYGGAFLPGHVFGVSCLTGAANRIQFIYDTGRKRFDGIDGSFRFVEA